MIYTVDFGDHFEKLNNEELQALYNEIIDKNEYKAFCDWFYDMKKCGLIIED